MRTEQITEQACSDCRPDGEPIELRSNGKPQFCTCQRGRQRMVRFFRDSLPLRLREFTLATYPATSRSQKAALAAVQSWVSSGTGWLVLHGPFGVGKTGLAKSAAEALIEAGRVEHPMFASTVDLLDRLRHSFRRNALESEGDILDQFRDAQVLVLDDLGAERATDWATDRLLNLLAWRYDQQLPTIVTSNLTPQQLNVHLGEQGQRIVWRIIEAAGPNVLSLRTLPNLRERRRAA